MVIFIVLIMKILIIMTIIMILLMMLNTEKLEALEHYLKRLTEIVTNHGVIILNRSNSSEFLYLKIY